MKVRTQILTALKLSLLLTLSVAQGLSAAAVASPGRQTQLQIVIDKVDQGDFANAQALIDQRTDKAEISRAERESLEFERERMHRILLDFTLTAADAKAKLRKQIPDLHDEEFEKWDAAGLLERRTIDGRTLYFNRSPSNLILLSADARLRRKEQSALAVGPMESANAHHREVRDAALAVGTSHVAPRRIRVTQSITVNADAVPPGAVLRAWIPYPRDLPGQQEAVRLIASEPAHSSIAPASTMQRTVYLEKPAQAGKPTLFSISYELTVFAQYKHVDPTRVYPKKVTPELKPFMTERPPHVVYTNDLRAFSRKIVGDEKNPYLIARKLFDAVDRIPWAGALEYSTIRNISDYALHAGHADCGQQTLLLISLLRLNGIPARWQSGMVYSEGDYWNLHDWGWLYLAPYGWIPMDVTFGHLDDPDPQIAGFYLGGFDAYRIAFNDDYSRDLVPAKRFFRSETVDLQRGEVEWSGGNLYFNQWDYDFDATVLAPAPTVNK